jgi:ABC-2 type transport system permease protein
VRALRAQLGAELLLLSRRGENLLVTAIIPPALLLFMGSVVGTSTVGTDMGFLVAGILSLAIVSTSLVSLGISTAYERHYGVLKRLLGSPLGTGRLLLARVLAVLLVQTLQVALVVGLAWLVYGYWPTGSLLLGGLVLLFGSVAFAGMGLLIAGTVAAEATLALANGLYLLFLLGGGFIWPLDRLPAPLSTVANLLPSAALSESVRWALTGGGVPALALIALAVWAVVLAIAAARLFRAE